MTVDTSWRGVIKAGGLSLLAGGMILFLFILSIFVFQVELPLTAQGFLDNPLPPALLFSMAALGEFLLMPGVLGIYFSLKDVNKNSVFLGTAIWIFAVPMFLVSRGQVISLVSIAGEYAASTDPTLRVAYFVAIQYALDLSNAYAVMALDLLGVGGIILGLVMLKGVFSRRTGYLVILAGALTVMGTFGVILEPLTIGTLFGLILNGVWQVIIGIKLYTLGAKEES
ncbi:MAG: hypothetical protein JSW61_12010 [Candidatus Thorarchaeota archaeon]|nr:MAG: hypothetical protein JSW61_12010 [Candidatus Thorarchaeota archaeon]